MIKLYISPSSQQSNIGPGGYIEEQQMNLIADILIPELIRHGFEVMRNNPENTYKQHVTESNLFKPDYHIAIHSNASAATSSHTARGCTVYCYDPSDANRKGTQMAAALYKYLEPLTPVNDLGIKNGRYILSEIANTNAPAVLVEIDFHDTVDGAEFIRSHINEIANAFLMGILEQCGVAYIPIIAPQPDPLPDACIYRVQVGAFSIRENAEKMVQNLVAAGFNAIIVKGAILQ